MFPEFGFLTRFFYRGSKLQLAEKVLTDELVEEYYRRVRGHKEPESPDVMQLLIDSNDV